jgi:DNA-binding transcriptional ArsR family regulator
MAGMTHPVADQQATVEALLDSSKRKARVVPIRSTFIQQRDTEGKPRAGPLADLVTSHDERALDLYLLFLAVATRDPYDSTKPAPVWARGLGLLSPKVEYNASAVSRAWSRLEKHGLVRRERKGRLARIIALCEDGSGNPYVPARALRERYLKCLSSTGRRHSIGIGPSTCQKKPSCSSPSAALRSSSCP